MVQESSGGTDERTAYFRSFDRALANICLTALDGDTVGSGLVLEMLYPPEAIATAASAGFREGFSATDTAALFAVSHAISFERSNGKIARLASASVRRRYELHVRIAKTVKSRHPSLTNDMFGRFMNAFVNQAR